ncbi:hypothetical protein AAC387_Pa06g1085 [Persea americana]
MGTCNWTRGRAIGRGSTATVSLATAHRSGEIFAVKSAELSHSQSLQHEEKILSQLNHPRIVSGAGCDTTTENGREFFNLFMEFVPGGSLSDSIWEGGRLEEPEIQSYTRDIVEGVAYLHSKNLVHCDIKGRNVLIGSDGAKIADMGCAREVDVAGGAVSGTPLFMAPEAARGEEQGFAADVWAVGCTVIEMATGSPPWPETKDPVSALFRIAYSVDVPEFPSWLSDQAKDFLSKCLRRNPDERWTADQLLNHPFVDGRCSLTKAVVVSVPTNSPKSTLDFEFWDSLGESGTDRELTQFEYAANSPAERIRRLAGGDSSPRRPNWTWEENWVTVSGSEECQIAAGEEMSGPDSNCGGDSDHQGLDCSTSSSDLVNDCCFQEGNSTGFVIKGRDYSTNLVNDIWHDEGIFVCSGDSFLCWKGFVNVVKFNVTIRQY